MDELNKRSNVMRSDMIFIICDPFLRDFNYCCHEAVSLEVFIGDFFLFRCKPY